MVVLVVGLLLFLGGHSIRIVAPRWRDRMVERLGEGGWKGLYSVAAIGGIALIAWGYGLSRLDPVVLYDPPVWTRHLSLVLLMPVFVLFAAAYLPGHIKARLKHPMLVSVKLWAAAHLIANGTLADVVLFGAFLAWAVADRISVKRRPVAAPGHGVEAPGSWANDLIALVIGATVYVIFLVFLHEWLIGVSPLS